MSPLLQKRIRAAFGRAANAWRAARLRLNGLSGSAPGCCAVRDQRWVEDKDSVPSLCGRRGRFIPTQKGGDERDYQRREWREEINANR